MHELNLTQSPTLVVGAGLMGIGIAQVAAQAGHPVLLFDLRVGAAQEAKDKLTRRLTALVSKGKFSGDAVTQALTLIQPIASLTNITPVGLVIEAVVEQLDVKRALFQQLETIVRPQCVLASNTSSLSVTALADGLQHPERLVGMHFFNPVPLMRLVEVVSGLKTSPAVAKAVFDLSQHWGKVPVHAKSTPGFIVNRIARPFYAEALALKQEQALDVHVLDACIRAAGFRMGPFELMDLIGHDISFAVTQSMFEAYFYDKRYAPSLVQKELIDGGLWGRKTGRGFYDYTEGVIPPQLEPFVLCPPPDVGPISVHGQGVISDAIAQTLYQAGAVINRMPLSPWVGLELSQGQLRLTDGQTASQIAAQFRTYQNDGKTPVAVFDLPLVCLQTGSLITGTPLAWAVAEQTPRSWQMQADMCLRALGFDAQLMQDTPGLVVARTLAMLINEAADAVQQGVCTPEAADQAMKLGLHYPGGPFEWLALWRMASDKNVVHLLDQLDHIYRGERYRVNPALRRHDLTQDRLHTNELRSALDP